MAKIVAGMASSHAFTLMEPDTWDKFRSMNRRIYAGRFGDEPPENPRIAQESDEYIRQRYSKVRQGLQTMHDRLRATNVDALVIVGDDQDENFINEIPQFAIYTGDQYTISNPMAGPVDGRIYQNCPELAELMYRRAVDDSFDVTGYHSFPEDKLSAHAVGPLLAHITPEGDIPVVPVFIESIHVPAPNPRRCYEFGQSLRRSIESWEGGDRVAVCASGGLSHFSAGYPYEDLEDRDGVAYGSLDEEFDQYLINKLESGRGHELVNLSNKDLLDHGEVEFRSWMVLLGMVGGDIPAEMLAYEPFYRAIMAMGLAYWNLDPVALNTA